MTSTWWPMLFMLCAFRCQSFAAQCSDLNEAERATILTYVAGKYHVPNSVALLVKSSEEVGKSCFRRLVVEGSRNGGSWSLTLFVSPDHQFMSSDLMDTRLDPKMEEIQHDQEVLKGLSAGSPPVRGANDAKVTIVVFSDFQCPYCKTFEELLSTELTRRPEIVKVVFRHFPLASHPWARKAAEAAACGQLQNSKAFWDFHDKIFANQDSLNVNDIDGELLQIATNSDLDVGKYRNCMDNQMSLGLVARDLKAGSLYEVDGTPSVFINGKRVQVAKTLAELDTLVDQARSGTLQ